MLLNVGKARRFSAVGMMFVCFVVCLCLFSSRGPRRSSSSPGEGLVETWPAGKNEKNAVM